jgi:hypothetical protein
MPDEMQACRPSGAGRTRRTGGTGVAFLTRWPLRSGRPLLAGGTLRTRAAREREHCNGDNNSK